MLAIKDVKVVIEGKIICDQISFCLHTPSFLAIIGANGCGKSTLLKALVKDIPSTGTFLYNQTDINAFTSSQIANIIGYLPQSIHLPFDIKAIELVVMGRYAKKNPFAYYNQEDYAKALEALQTVGAEHLAQQQFSTLSGGEQKMVLIAQLILQDTAIMLLDEPMASLDINNRFKLITLMKKWVTEGKYVITVAHELDFLENIEGSVLHFENNTTVLNELSKSELNRIKEYYKS